MVRSARSVAWKVLLSGALAAAALGCSGGSDEAEPKPTTTTAAVEEAAVTTVTTVAGSCGLDELQGAAGSAQAGSTVSEEACYGDAAVALLTGGEVGDGVVFFRFVDGAWTVLVVEPRDATLAERLPEGFPTILFGRWWKAHAPEGALGTGQSASVGGGAGTEGDLGDDVFYDSEMTTTTTAPPTTTTTAPPDTTTTAPQLDPYCIEFPEEPSCLEDPYLR